MDVDHEDKLLLMEIQTLCAETLARTKIVLSDKNEDHKDRRLMALALLATCRDLNDLLPEEGDWSEEFGQNLEAHIEDEETRYQDAKCAEDRRERILALAHLRILRRIKSRLTDPLRRQSLIPEIYTDPLYPANGRLHPEFSVPEDDPRLNPLYIDPERA